MNIKETRRLGIEFERRVQTMIPEKEYLEKLDTDTIYSYLNQYQAKYIHEIYRNLDKIESGSTLQMHVESILQKLLCEKELSSATGIDDNWNINDSNGAAVSTGRSVKYVLPDDFYLYVRSTSKVKSTFSFKTTNKDKQAGIRVIPNQHVSQSDVWKLIETPHNSLRILRNPAAVITPFDSDTNGPTLTVIYDQYTEPDSVVITYYKQPQEFDVMTSVPCELPMDAFEELVSGAVDLYVDYVAGAEARKRRIQEAQQQRAREDERDARRNRTE